MMITGVFLLSLLTFVCSQSVEVPYVQSIESIEDLTKQLEDEIISMEDNIPDITDPRRHYAVIMTHLVRVADALRYVDGDEYAEVFINDMPDNIRRALLNVEDTIQCTQVTLDKIDNGTNKVQALVDTLCNETTTTEVCNQVVDQAVTGDPERYIDQAELLLFAGDVSQKLLEADLVSVANAYDEQSYLINHIDSLKGVVEVFMDILSRIN